MIGVLEKSPGGEPHQADPTIIPPSKALPGMTFSLFDHPHFSALLKHEDIASLFGVEAEMTAMLRFETALAEAEAELGVIPGEAALAITEAAGDFEPDLEKLSEGVQQDGVIGPSLIASLKEAVPEAFRPFVHFGATSQDVVDTGLILRLQAAIAILKRDLKAVVAHLDRLSSEMGNVRIMGRTRMQRALPIAFDDRVATWKSPLMRHLQKLDHLENTALAVQFGGAVGTLHLLGAQGGNVRTALARRLDLIDPGRPWHAERDRIVDIASWLASVSGSIGKIGQDLALMAQNEIGEASLGDGGRSSAMPHKRNPIQAEILITLARLNASHIAGIHQAMVHEAERSGAAWTLEWMLLPEMAAASASSLRIAAKSLDHLKINETS